MVRQPRRRKLVWATADTAVTLTAAPNRNTVDLLGAYYTAGGVHASALRVGARALRGRCHQQIEDAVSYLATLKEGER